MISTSPLPPVRIPATVIGVALVAILRPLMEQDAFTEEQWEFFGDPFTDMDDDCVVDGAAQHTRAVAAVVTAAAASCDAQKAIGGSILGRRRNIDRGFDEGFTRINSDYFGVNPAYDAATFARRFRMPHSVFNRIYTALSGRPEFLRKADALGVLGLYPLQRIVAAIRMLGYGTAADACDEYIRISEPSASDALRLFCEAVCEEFGGEYGRQPKADDLRRILSINAMRGFPGCLGSIDCQHWQWERCPVAFAGQFTGK
jgi:hypothetical protein